MKIGFVIKKINDKNGPIAESVKSTGIDLLDFSMTKEMKDYDYLIVFYNKIPPFIETKAKIAWWMCDFRKPKELVTEPDSNFDLIFLCHKTYDDLYMQEFKKPIFFMPQCGIEEETLQSVRKVDWETLFIGTIDNKKYWHRDRRNLIDYLSTITNLKTISGEKNSIDQKFLYKNTPFNLSVSFPMICGTSNRLYNILSSGGFALVRWFPEIEFLFENHKHLVWFKEMEEIPQILSFYKQNKDELNNIRIQGNLLYNKKHSARRRVNNMIEIMTGKSNEFNGYI